jgi:hypothetical protein
MKNRIVLWGAVLSLASIATAASFHIPQVHVNADPNRLAKELGVDPAELKDCTHMARQLSSDLRYGRSANKANVAHLVKVTKKGGALAGEVYWNILPIRKKAYRDQFVTAAAISGTSKNENEACAAINLLKGWNDPRWKDLATKYAWSNPELKAAVLEPRWGQ